MAQNIGISETVLVLYLLSMMGGNSKFGISFIGGDYSKGDTL